MNPSLRQILTRFDSALESLFWGLAHTIALEFRTTDECTHHMTTTKYIDGILKALKPTRSTNDRVLTGTNAFELNRVPNLQVKASTFDTEFPQSLHRGLRYRARPTGNIVPLGETSGMKTLRYLNEARPFRLHVKHAAANHVELLGVSGFMGTCLDHAFDSRRGYIDHIQLLPKRLHALVR